LVILLRLGLSLQQNQNKLFEFDLGPDFSGFLIIFNKLSWYDPTT
jgi:hypothetical protein